MLEKYAYGSSIPFMFMHIPIPDNDAEDSMLALSARSNLIFSPAGPSGKITLEYASTSGLTHELQVPLQLFAGLCRCQGNDYKAKRWIEARLAEVNGLSPETVERYLNFMLRNYLISEGVPTSGQRIVLRTRCSIPGSASMLPPFTALHRYRREMAGGSSAP